MLNIVHVEYFKDPLGSVYKSMGTLLNKDGVPLIGVCKVVSETDKWDVIVNYQLVEIEPNYVPALDVGTKTTTIEKKEKYFLVKNNKVFELSNSRKKIMKELEGEKIDLEPFFKENKLDIKNSGDLAAFVGYLNQNG